MSFCELPMWTPSGDDLKATGTLNPKSNSILHDKNNIHNHNNGYSINHTKKNAKRLGFCSKSRV